MGFDVAETDVLEFGLTAGAQRHVDLDVDRIAIGALARNIAVNEQLFLDGVQIDLFINTDKPVGHGGIIT